MDLITHNQLGDKRIPEGPASSKSLPPTTPSAPRAMSGGGDGSRGAKQDSMAARDRDWKGGREQRPPTGLSGSNIPVEDLTVHGSSLRSRIGDKEPSRSLAQISTSSRSDAADRKSDHSARDDERDGSRKRTMSGMLLNMPAISL